MKSLVLALGLAAGLLGTAGTAPAQVVVTTGYGWGGGYYPRPYYPSYGYPGYYGYRPYYPGTSFSFSYGYPAYGYGYRPWGYGYPGYGYGGYGYRPGFSLGIVIR